MNNFSKATIFGIKNVDLLFFLKQSQNKQGWKFVSAEAKTVSYFTAGSWENNTNLVKQTQIFGPSFFDRAFWLCQFILGPTPSSIPNNIKTSFKYIHSFVPSIYVSTTLLTLLHILLHKRYSIDDSEPSYYIFYLANYGVIFWWASCR